jgi:hypothetical protein
VAPGRLNLRNCPARAGTRTSGARSCYVPRMNRGIIGTIIGILVIIVLVLVIMNLT